ncbi:MAG: cation-translocating P-type ATPase [Anaerolineales bacterium]
MPTWYDRDIAEVMSALSTSMEGLDPAEAARRLKQYGPNQLEERRGRSPWLIFLSQFTDIMVIVLLAAAVISFLIALHDPNESFTDAIMILVIVILNAILGFVQEYRAERAMAALKKLAVSHVRVRRGGITQEIEATQLVPGDVFYVDAGLRVPADARLIEAANLRVDESALTGESVPVDKVVEPLSGPLATGDQLNMVFMGTTAVYGRGTAVATATGMQTELGHIAHMIQDVGQESTPLQRRMAELGKWLAIGALIICSVVFVVGILVAKQPLVDMFITAVSLAVAAVPEGLPAVVTIALALGSQRMIKRQALIRRLPAVETLGSVTTICSDKTGTLTENRMTVTVLDIAGSRLDLEASLDTEGALLTPGDAPLGLANQHLAVLLAAGSLCNDAALEPDPERAERYRAVGDPTEGALVVAAAQKGLWKQDLEQALPRVAEVPFSSERKRMTTIHRVPADWDGREGDPVHGIIALLADVEYVAFTKGSPDGLIEISRYVYDEGHIVPLDEDWRDRIAQANEDLAGNGMRVLAGAFRPLAALPDKVTDETVETDLVFVGLVGMIDPPRPEVHEAVAKCRTAGIRPVMITGDHPLTALNIARDLGIAAPDAGTDAVITGRQLEDMSVEELAQVVETISVYARVSPEHKVKIVEALKSKGEFVAMTGDGVNDAPALKRADIGIAMGISGTDVSKEAADMVLLDDNFATIVHAIEEGRTIYENIRKFVKYIVSSNVGEIFLMLMAPLLGLPLPLTAVQLLWVNLVTDGLPGLALSMEHPAADTMSRPPHPPNESVLARGLGTYILWMGLLLGGVSLATEYAGNQLGWEGEYVWRTMVFTVLSLSQMGNALSVRSDRESLFTLGLLSNPSLLGAVLLTTALQLAVVYVPFLQRIFGTVPLHWEQLLVSLALSAIVFVAAEVVKLVGRRREQVHAG